MSSLVLTETVRQELDRYWEEHCRPPTIRELMELCDINSTSHVKYHLDILCQMGRISLKNGSRGAIPLWVESAIQDWVEYSEAA